MKEENNKKKAKKKRKIKKGHIKKKLKTLYKQKVIRDFVVLFLIQIIIICFFCFAYFDTVDVSNAKTVEITVERIDYRQLPLVLNLLLCVYSDSDEYVFPRASTFQDYGNAELEKAIHIGDKLELTYVERNWRFNEINYIVDARSGNEIYRNIEIYTERGFISTMFRWAIPIVIEVIYLAIVFLFIWIHKEKLDFRK